jgi:hypothetical protein
MDLPRRQQPEVDPFLIRVPRYGTNDLTLDG